MIIENSNLIHWYKKGFSDETRGGSSVMSGNIYEDRAYIAGVYNATLEVKHYIPLEVKIGSDKEILKLLKK